MLLIVPWSVAIVALDSSVRSIVYTLACIEVAVTLLAFVALRFAGRP